MKHFFFSDQQGPQWSLIGRRSRSTWIQSGGWMLKDSERGAALYHCLFSIFNNSRKNNGHAFSGTFAPWLYNSNNHCPCARPVQCAVTCALYMWPSPGPLPDSKCSKTVEVRCSYKSKTLSARDGIRERKIIESTAIFVSAILEPMLLDSLWLVFTTELWVCIDMRNKRYMTRHVSQPWTDFLCEGLHSDCLSWIWRPERPPDKKYKNSWQQAFTCAFTASFSKQYKLSNWT